MMKESTRTLAFVIVAAASAALAGGIHYATRPAPITEAADIGKEFYPEFQNSNDAKSLRLVAFDEDTATYKEFAVEFKDGLWRIPSHHNYPADAEDRLANTAASVIGIKKEGLIGRRESEWERLGVIDPLDESSPSLKGRGQRITLTKEDGSVLCDLIIGKKITSSPGQEESEDRYYVRDPKDKSTYVAKVKIDLSTKFGDWIESDVLKTQRDELKEIVVDKYTIQEAPEPRITGQEVSKLTRDKSFDPWKLEGLKEETEEVATDKVNEMVGALDELKIVGVRPKPPGLTADLKVDRKVVQDQMQLNLLIGDMQNRGFSVVAGDDGNPKLVASDGELTAFTDKGVVYDLRFGAIFSGRESDIEVGFATDEKGKEGAAADDKTASEDKPADENEKAAAGEAKPADDPAAKGDEKPEEGKESRRSRYLLVSTRFDDKYIGPKPTKPEEPQKPAEAPTETPAEQPAGQTEGGGAQPTEQPAEQPGAQPADQPAPQPAADAPQDPAAAEQPAKPDPQAEYEAAKQKYDEDLKKYEEDLKAYEDKIKQGKETVEKLNRRFGEWYYVISADSFDKLHLGRADLVKPKEQPADPAASTNPMPETEATPGAEPRANPAPDAGEAPAVEAPKPEAASDAANPQTPGEEQPETPPQ